MTPITVLDSMTEERFVSDYLRRNQPVVVRQLDYDRDKWNPAWFKQHLGDLPVLRYDALFDLQEISTLASYLDDEFGREGGAYREKVPYVRWYNRIKDVEHAWGDEAFERLATLWKMPPYLPRRDMLIPVKTDVDPTVDRFPYRGILIAARGARTRMHRDPFCSDAMVAQFYGSKEVALYHPSRTDELRNKGGDGNSFGGFVDVRGEDLNRVSIEPDFHGTVGPGDVVYIPHGWLHDVIATEDSLSITWNFVHEMGSMEFIDYLMSGAETDSEFEVLNYFYALSGHQFANARDVVRAFDDKFAEIQDILECG